MKNGTRDVFETAFVWVGTAILFFLLWYVRYAIAIAFAAVLVAIFLRAIMRLVCRIPRLNEVAGLTIAVFLVLAIVILIVTLLGTAVTAQFHVVAQRIHAGQAAAVQYMRQHQMGAFAGDLTRNTGPMVHAVLAKFIQAAPSIAEGAIVLLVSALYFAVRPDIYRIGLAHLFGQRLFAKVSEGLVLIGTSLQLWLLGQLIVMAIVGIACCIALWLIGLPGALALGLIAGAAELVPYLGPFVAAVPALFAAATLGLHAVVWTLAVYLGIHMLEGYILSPLLQRHFLYIPPALVLIGILVSGMIFGILGIMIAAPLTAAVFTGTKVFYVRDTLKEKAEVPEESPL